MAATIITNEHYVPFEMERNHNENIKFRLKITEKTTIETKRTEVIAEIQYLTPVEISNYTYKPQIVINGEKPVDYDLLDSGVTRTLYAGSDYVELHKGGWTFSHDSNGKLSISVTATIKADEILIFEVYQTKGSASYSGTATIDMSLPYVKEMEVSADRYGFNAVANMIVGHASYPLESVVFKLYGLTEEQAKNRRGKHEQETNGTYTAILTEKYNLSSTSELFFNLDAIYASKYPLNTGTSYSYSVILTAINSKTFTFNDSFYVPQKVTGITCESLVELLVGKAKYLSYQVFPQNAEDPSVFFSSSNEYVASIDEYGVIEAKHNGSCFITAKTVDGSFIATCEVNVVDTENFPQLTSVEYLSEDTTEKIISAILFLAKRLTEKGITVPTLSEIVFTGKSHPVKEIRNVLETIESCCQILKTASNTQYPCSTLPTPQTFPKYNTDKRWFLIVNEWINFLIELNEKTA